MHPSVFWPQCWGSGDSGHAVGQSPWAAVKTRTMDSASWFRPRPPSGWRLCDASAGVDTKCGHVNVAKDGLLQTGPRLVRLILAKRCDKSRLRSDCLVQIKCQMPLCVGLLNDTMSNCVIITMLRLTYVKHQPVCFVFTCRLSSAQTRSMVSEKDFTLFFSSSVFFLTPLLTTV